MAPEGSLWTRWLFHIGRLRASEAELGDLQEEYAHGERSVLWLARQILSTLGSHPSRNTIPERRPAMLSNIWSDTRYAVRMFRRNPAFAAAAIVPIALGIGINTGLFSVLNSVAWRPLPTPDSSELISVHQEFRGVQRRRVHGARSMFSMPEYRVYRDSTRTLSGVMAYSRPWTATLGGQSPQEIEGALVTCNYFDVLRVRPLIGTGFPPVNCDTPATPPAVILSYALWTRAFGSDPDIVSKTITLNGQEVAVAGVAPEGFHGIDVTKVRFFAPIGLQTVLQSEDQFHEDAHISWLTLVGRRSRDSSMAQVRAELAVIASRIDRQQPGRTTAVIATPATSLSVPVARRDIFSIAAVVLLAFLLVLSIACANVANLLLARAAGRTKEIAVRLSVGASRARLVQQMLTESAIIALVGGAAGSILAWWSFQGMLAWLLSSLPGTIPPLSIDAHPDRTVLWFAVALTASTVLVFGLLPALQASRQDVHTALRQDVAGTGRRIGGWLRSSLVALQVGVCMVLLISAALLLRGMHAAGTVEPGFEYRNVAAVSIDLRGPRYDDQKVLSFHEEVMEAVGSLPGVDAVAQVGKMPLSPGRHQTMFRLPGMDEWHEVDVNTVSPEYFSLIAVPIVRGRTFTPPELGTASRTVILTEATARRYWPGQDPIGRTVIMSLGLGQEVSRDVVGVAKDAQISRVGETPSSYMYLPAAPGTQRRLGLLVRSQTDFGALASGIRDVTRRLDPGLVVRVNRLEENLQFWQSASRVVAGLSGSLSLLALLLASVGVYGVVSYVVSHRRREVGLRMALGATGRDVLVLILRQTLRPVAVGGVIGIAAGAAATQVLQSVLFGISPLDPVAFVTAPLFLLGVAVVATLLPTREALKLDPMATLRYE